MENWSNFNIKKIFPPLNPTDFQKFITITKDHYYALIG